ncbi:hypothetical protein BKA58DRAFT_197252 [Alternaria rosae]|uniref:uncharacterized protein n=1 Tax=Alternaria rosae TaxID=1187941 RepID=UPI001E8D81A0|nr:uncharacterized protein BKA58DRAFT_197252 [Alternaria rosae]KAH6868578.1 hypothetical protein BKA58DRAFT_197252 [Alternaria rosae]
MIRWLRLQFTYLSLTSSATRSLLQPEQHLKSHFCTYLVSRALSSSFLQPQLVLIITEHLLTPRSLSNTRRTVVIRARTGFRAYLLQIAPTTKLHVTCIAPRRLLCDPSCMESRTNTVDRHSHQSCAPIKPTSVLRVSGIHKHQH